jgi:hypothetical protein
VTKCFYCWFLAGRFTVCLAFQKCACVCHRSSNVSSDVLSPDSNDSGIQADLNKTAAAKVSLCSDNSL